MLAGPDPNVGLRNRNRLFAVLLGGYLAWQLVFIVVLTPAGGLALLLVPLGLAFGAALDARPWARLGLALAVGFAIGGTIARLLVAFGAPVGAAGLVLLAATIGITAYVARLPLDLRIRVGRSYVAHRVP